MYVLAMLPVNVAQSPMGKYAWFSSICDQCATTTTAWFSFALCNDVSSEMNQMLFGAAFFHERPSL